MINKLKPAVFAVATALASVAAFADPPADLTREQAQDTINLKAIDNFLDDSRRYLDL